MKKRPKIIENRIRIDKNRNQYSSSEDQNQENEVLIPKSKRWITKQIDKLFLKNN